MHALRVLDFERVLDQVAEHAHTDFGKTAVRRIAPEFDTRSVAARVEETREATQLIRAGSVSDLHGLTDVRSALQRTAKGSVLGAADLYAIGRSLSVVQQLRLAVKPSLDRVTALLPYVDQLCDDEGLAARLTESFDADGEVNDAASVELSKLRARRRSLLQSAQAKIQSYVSGSTRDYLSDAIVTQRQGRFVIPLKAEHRGKVKGIVHDTSTTGQTLYVEPQDVLEIGNRVRETEAAEKAEIERILKAMSAAVGAKAALFAAGIEAGMELDVIFARARYGLVTSGELPDLDSAPGILLKRARHPLLPKESAIPMDIVLGKEVQAWLITGPNTGGKTISLKTVGLAVAMAQSGIPFPCEKIQLGPYTQIWADIGDEQSLEQSLSTFSGHIRNIAEALNEMKSGALVILDEVGAGTDPAEGAALARAILLTLIEKGAHTMASTHYGELKLLSANFPEIGNASMEFDLKSLRPTYRLVLGIPGSSHALKIARRYQMPESVILKAEAEVGEQQQDIARMIQQLEQAEKRANRAQGEADRLANQLRKVEAEAQAKLAEAKERRRTARQDAADELEAALRELRREAENIFEELKRRPTDQGMQHARQRLQEVQGRAQKRAQSLKPKTPKPTFDPHHLAKGVRVKLTSTSQTGTLLSDPRNGKVEVQVGAFRMQVAVNQIQAIEPEAPSAPARAQRSSGKLTMDRASRIAPELHLRHMRAEDASLALADYIDDAILAGLTNVRIVHGKGGGVLREVVHDQLRTHRHVREFTLAPADEGGDGVTIATLK